MVAHFRIFPVQNVRVARQVVAELRLPSEHIGSPLAWDSNGFADALNELCVGLTKLHADCGLRREVDLRRQINLWLLHQFRLHAYLNHRGFYCYRAGQGGSGAGS